MLKLAFLLLAIQWGSDPVCDQENFYESFKKDTYPIENWIQLNRMFQQNKKCEKDDLKDLEYVVERLFKNDYKAFFAAKLYQDKAFYKFVKENISAYWPQKSLKNLSRKLRSGCPKGRKAVCKDLNGRVNEVFENYAENHDS